MTLTYARSVEGEVVTHDGRCPAGILFELIADIDRVGDIDRRGLPARRHTAHARRRVHHVVPGLRHAILRVGRVHPDLRTCTPDSRMHRVEAVTARHIEALHERDAAERTAAAVAAVVTVSTERSTIEWTTTKRTTSVRTGTVGTTTVGSTAIGPAVVAIRGRKGRVHSRRNRQQGRKGPRRVQWVLPAGPLQSDCRSAVWMQPKHVNQPSKSP